MSCKTSIGMVTSKKDGKKPENTMVVKEEGEAVEQEPISVKTKVMLGRAHRPQRTAAMRAKACLDKYCKLNFPVRDLTDVGTVPASVLLGRKHPATDMQPSSWK